MRNIAVFTGSRAEFGLQLPVLQKLQASPECTLQLLVSGSHTSDSHGRTITDIKASGIPIAAMIPVESSSDSALATTQMMSIILSRVAESLVELKSDLLVVLGDRYESFCAVVAATMVGIPIAHIHGGEKTEGALDEQLRHGMTKLSHLHFTALQEYQQRVIQMGEHPSRVFCVGALGIEVLENLVLPDRAALESDLDVSLSQTTFLVTWHPETLADEPEPAQIHQVLAALDAFPDATIIFTGPNADPGNCVVETALRDYVARSRRARLVPHLGQIRYLGLAKQVNAVIGNSSSGILEIPSLGVPTVNIGDRQKGRVSSESVIHCACQTQDIVASISRSQSADCQKRASRNINPYRGDQPSQDVVDVLIRFDLSLLRRKSFYDLPIVA